MGDTGRDQRRPGRFFPKTPWSTGDGRHAPHHLNLRWLRRVLTGLVLFGAIAVQLTPDSAVAASNPAPPVGATGSTPSVAFVPSMHMVFSPQGSEEGTPAVTATESAPGAMPQGVVCLTVGGAATMDDNATNLNDVSLGVEGGGAVAQMQGIAGNDASFVISTPSQGTPASYTLSGLQLQTTTQTGPVLVELATGDCADTDPTNSTVVSTVQIGSVVAEPRTFGADRFSTATDLFLQSSSTASGGASTPARLAAAGAARAAAVTPACHANAVIASGANYPDALAANYLAGHSGLDTQILLVTQNGIPAEVLTALRLSGVAHVTIVGGTGAVSAEVASALSSTPAYGCGGTAPAGTNLSVSRIGGATRFDTAEQVVEYLGPDAVGTVNLSGAGHSPLRTAIVADGLDYPDAVSTGPMAYGGTNSKSNGNGEGFPLLLTDPSILSPQVAKAIQDNAITQVLIAGGSAAVSTTVESQLQALGVATVRFAGIDRTDTAAKLAAFETAPATGLTTDGLAYDTSAVDLVRGDGFTDALTVPGYSWSVDQGTPLLLAENPGNLGAPTTAYLEHTGAAPAAGYGTGTLNVFGGPGALLVSTVNAAALALAGG